MRPRALTTILAGAIALAGATVGLAQPPYEGVVPGAGQPPPRASAARRGDAPVVTWPGFQMLPDGRSRFFVQSTAPLRHDVEASAGRVVVLLRSARLHLRTNRLPLETRWFDTPVERARLVRRGRDLALVMELRGAATPSVRTQASPDGYHFLFVEFPDGDWVAAPAASEPAMTEEERRELEAMDEELPPDFGDVGPAGE